MLGENIKKIRQKKGYTQEVYISHNYISYKIFR